MTIFGWITIALWGLAAINSKETNARVLCVLMIVGTLIWGTGSL